MDFPNIFAYLHKVEPCARPAQFSSDSRGSVSPTEHAESMTKPFRHGYVCHRRFPFRPRRLRSPPTTQSCSRNTDRRGILVCTHNMRRPRVSRVWAIFRCARCAALPTDWARSKTLVDDNKTAAPLEPQTRRRGRRGERVLCVCWRHGTRGEKNVSSSAQKNTIIIIIIIPKRGPRVWTRKSIYFFLLT